MSVLSLGRLGRGAPLDEKEEGQEGEDQEGGEEGGEEGEEGREEGGLPLVRESSPWLGEAV